MEPSRETSGPGFGGGDVCGCPKTKHGTANISTTMTDSFFIGRSFGMSELMLCMSAKAVNMSSSFSSLRVHFAKLMDSLISAFA
jgi:hypothetical protein